MASEPTPTQSSFPRPTSLPLRPRLRRSLTIPYAEPYKRILIAAPGYYYPMDVSRRLPPRLGTWALVSMICGAVSIATFQSVLAILAVIFGFIGLNEVKKSQGTVEGRGFAIAGIVTGFISIGLTILFIALYILYFVFLFSALNTLPD